MRDRDQKQQALKFCVGSRWLPQLEVDVDPGRALAQSSATVTDLDVLASIPDEFRGYRLVVFDCKTKVRESPVNRALWLAGVIERMGADQGFCILKKGSIEVDHSLMANRLRVLLMSEEDFLLYGTATGRESPTSITHVADIGLWEQLFDIPKRYPRLEQGMRFVRSGFWMSEDPAEACRRTLLHIGRSGPEIDPAKTDHVALFFEFCTIFAHAMAVVVNRLFRVYLQPQTQTMLSNGLLMMLYGGREGYKFRNDVFRALHQIPTEEQKRELIPPEWDRLEHLARQMLDAPMDVQRAPLILREVGFSMLAGDPRCGIASTLCSEAPQAARFAVMIASYLVRAGRLPPELGEIADKVLLPLLPTK